MLIITYSNFHPRYTVVYGPIDVKVHIFSENDNIYWWGFKSNMR